MERGRIPRVWVAALGLMAVGWLGACGTGSPSVAPGSPAATTPVATGQRFPDVVDVKARKDGSTYTFEVTMTSPYDSPQRYADGWRIKGPDGTIYGEHTLDHDHATEQPFTRVQTGVPVPAGVDQVVVEGRDLSNGFGGTTRTVRLS